MYLPIFKLGLFGRSYSRLKRLTKKFKNLFKARNNGKKEDLRVRESDGKLMQQNKVFIPNVMELKEAILEFAYCSTYTMHPGGTKMYHTIRPFYYWPSMKREIAEYLPRTQNGFDGVWVIVDRLTKSAHFIPVKEKYPLNKLAKLFITKIVRYHGVPVNFISDRVYDVSNLVFLKLSPWRGVVRFGKRDKLSPRYIGPYEIIERIGEVAYRLELPLELSKVHNVFHVLMLRHYVSDPSHVIPPQPLEINLDLTYNEEPVTILDWKDKVLRNKTVSLVKVLWRNHSVKEATWETEDRMREMYPRLFYVY
ncbi:hypothetical protein ACFX13_020178 [Malus domestica]